MKNILYIVALVMIIGWAIGFFVFAIGAIIHVLIVLAVITILIKVFSKSKSV